jgi:hypothetical protein
MYTHTHTHTHTKTHTHTHIHTHTHTHTHTRALLHAQTHHSRLSQETATRLRRYQRKDRGKAPTRPNAKPWQNSAEPRARSPLVVRTVVPMAAVAMQQVQHCCYTVVTMYLHFCHTVNIPLSHCCYTVVTLLLHCCYTVVTLFLHCQVQQVPREPAIKGLDAVRKRLRDLVLSAVCCLLSAVCCLLSAVCCLLSAVCCLLSAVCCLLSAGD